MPPEEGLVGFRHEGVLNLVALGLVHPLHGAVLVGQTVIAAIVCPARPGHGTLVGEVALVGGPRLTEEEVVLARGVDDDFEIQCVYTCKRTAAGEDETFGAHGLGAVLLGLQAQVEGVYMRAGKDRVGNDQHHGHGLVGGHLALVEPHDAHIRLVAERILANGCRGGVGVEAAHVGAGIEGHRLLVGHIFNIGVIGQVLRRGGDDVATAYQTHLMNVRKDVLAHALAHALGTVVAAVQVLSHDGVGSDGSEQGTGESLAGRDNPVHGRKGLQILCTGCADRSRRLLANDGVRQFADSLGNIILPWLCECRYRGLCIWYSHLIGYAETTYLVFRHFGQTCSHSFFITRTKSITRVSYNFQEAVALLQA